MINSDIDSVWKCITDAKEMDRWGAGPARFEARVGGKFNMRGNYLKGTVTEFEANKKLSQDWQVDGMEEASKVTFLLQNKGDKTEITLEHSNIPDGLVDELHEGWDEYYLGAIKTYLQ